MFFFTAFCTLLWNAREFSLSGDIQDPPGQGPVQPAVGDPASAGGLDWVTHRGPFQPRPFCDFRTLLQSQEDPRGQNILATREGVKNHDFTPPTTARCMDQAAQKEEEETESLNPRQLIPACSISTPVCTIVNVGSWQKPELGSLLSWWIKGWVRTDGSGSCPCCAPQLPRDMVVQSLPAPLACPQTQAQP